MIKSIRATEQDRRLLHGLIEKGIPSTKDQPIDYSGLVVLKPWGYEFQVFDNGLCCVWFACLNSGHAVSLHCHQHKKAAFVPLSDGIHLCTLDGLMPLSECIAVDAGVFHSQENDTLRDSFFLEYEWPSDKTDIVRLKDRYGRESKGYEGKNKMIPFATAIDRLNLPDVVKVFLGRAA